MFPSPTREPSTTTEPLARPLGALLHVVRAAHPEDSIRAVAGRMREDGAAAMPVASGGQPGLVRQEDLLRALAEGADPLSPIRDYTRFDAPVLPAHALGSAALRAMEAGGWSCVIVADVHGHVLGIVDPALLIAPRVHSNRPRMVGGMATPFGVYLTNGQVSGGAGPWALIATGAVMFSLFMLANVASYALYFGGWLNRLPPTWHAPILDGLVLVLFLLGLRSIPLAGIHAAEHMTVHAIERGEEIDPSTVARMPRVHPRCGTNLAVGAMLFLGLMGAPWIADAELRLILAGFATLLLWRPLGGFLQWAVTTKPPTRKQIELGVRAGKDLLAKAEWVGDRHPNLLKRLALSGMFQIMVGAFATHALIAVLAYLLKVPQPWQGILTGR